MGLFCALQIVVRVAEYRVTEDQRCVEAAVAVLTFAAVGMKTYSRAVASFFPRLSVVDDAETSGVLAPPFLKQFLHGHLP